MSLYESQWVSMSLNESKWVWMSLNESEWVWMSLSVDESEWVGDGESQWASIEWVVTAISHGYRKRVWSAIAYRSSIAYRSAIAYRGSAYGLKAILDWFLQNFIFIETFASLLVQNLSRQGPSNMFSEEFLNVKSTTKDSLSTILKWGLKIKY